MPNAYVDLATIKGTGGLNIAGTAYDARLRGIAENISREIDRFCNRQFYYYVGTLFFDGDGSIELIVPDLVSIDSIAEDTNFDGTFETTWGASDYILYPRNADPTGTHDKAGPYSRLVVSEKSNGTQDLFINGKDMYRVVGTWGYSKTTRDSLLNGTLADSTATSLVLSGSASGTIEVGMTLLVDDEQVYVTATTGTSATVTRAVNGTTGTAHTNKDVNIVTYPGPVVEAVFMQVARLWKRRDSGFASQIGVPETGQLTVWQGGLDKDVQMLLWPYRRFTV